MSYVKKISHTITISRADLIEMIEDRYGVANIPENVDIKARVSSHHQYSVEERIKNDPIMVNWQTTETYASFPADADAVTVEKDDIPF